MFVKDSFIQLSPLRASARVTGPIGEFIFGNFAFSGRPKCTKIAHRFRISSRRTWRKKSRTIPRFSRASQGTIYLHDAPLIARRRAPALLHSLRAARLHLLQTASRK